MGLQNSIFPPEDRLINPKDLIGFAYLKSPNSETFDHFRSLIRSKGKESFETALEELILLTKENEEFVLESEHNGPRGQYLNASIVEVIMRMCERFNVSDHVKFHSLELYNRWMNLLADDLRIHSKKIRKLHLKIYKRKLTLIMSSCIQLASKSVGRQSVDFYDFRDITDYIVYQGTDHIMVSSSAILQLLTSLHPKLQYSLNDILQSEINVFRRFSYNLKVITVMEVVESIVVIFVTKATEFQKIYALCLIAVDFYYLRKAEIFGEYQKLVIKSGIKMNSRVFNRHQSDYIFIAVAIIHLIISQDPSERKPDISLSQLEIICGIQSPQIAFLASAFAKFLLVKDNLLHLQPGSSAAPKECGNTN